MPAAGLNAPKSASAALCDRNLTAVPRDVAPRGDPNQGRPQHNDMMRTLQAVVGLCALAFVVLVLVANRDCAPTYFERGDVLALLCLAVVFSGILAWASARDTDPRRSAGSLASAGVAAIFLSTASLPTLVAPIALAAALRLPRGAAPRLGTEIALPLVVLAALGLVLLGQTTVPAQFRCP